MCVIKSPRAGVKTRGLVRRPGAAAPLAAAGAVQILFKFDG